MQVGSREQGMQPQSSPVVAGGKTLLARSVSNDLHIVEVEDRALRTGPIPLSREVKC